jgi:hypothetical protein
LNRIDSDAALFHIPSFMREVSAASIPLWLKYIDHIIVQQILGQSIGYANDVDRFTLLYPVTIRTVLEAVKQISFRDPE